MVTDQIADMLTRIKNAYLARHQTVEIPCSKIKEKIIKILIKEGYLKNCKKEKVRGKIKKLICELVYKDKQPALTDLKKVSKPGKRVYTRWSQIPQTLSGYGITLVSTSKGIMTDEKAKNNKLGGEIICKIY